MLTLAAIALILPAAFQAALGTERVRRALVALSVSISIVLLVVYVLYLVFSLVTHSVALHGLPRAARTAGRASRLGVRRSVLGARGRHGVIAWMSEIMVGAIEPTAHELGLSNVFVGVFVVAILGNAAEHATAITAAMKNRMDLSLSIAIGSSVQVALFVAPVLVLVSLLLGPAPMDLAFPAGLVLTVLLSVLMTGQIAGDGRSDWLKGMQLLAVYLVLGITFFFVPNVMSCGGTASSSRATRSGAERMQLCPASIGRKRMCVMACTFSCMPADTG